jgi:zinc and cadmium transporter
VTAVLLVWVVVFSLIGSVGAVLGAGLFLLSPDRARERLIPCLLSYATGTLLGAAFLGMIPQSLAVAEPETVSATVLAGIILFFLLEKIAIWRHCHERDCEVHASAGPLILIGDAFHNFVDGLVIASAFLAGIPLGIAASLAVIAHEVPQEVGDFAILLDSGYQRGRALLYNALSSVTTVPGAIVGFFYLNAARDLIPYVLAVSAASFIYIAVADLVPGLHRSVGLRASVGQAVLIVLGIATVGFAVSP